MLEVVERSDNITPPVDNTGYSPIYTAVAGSSLSSGRVVCVINGTAVYFNPGDVSMSGLMTGITKSAALAGSKVVIQLSGAFYESGLGLVQGREYYAGPDGMITINPAGLKLVQSIGSSIDVNTININIQLSIETI